MPRASIESLILGHKSHLQLYKMTLQLYKMTNGDTGSRFNVFLLKFIPLLKNRKTKTRKFRFNAAGCSLSKTIYIKRFSGVFRTKIWEQLSWSQTSQWDEISFTKRNFWGNNMHKFTHIHCWTANRWFSRPRQCPRLCVDDEAGMRSSVQVVRFTSGCRHSSSSTVLKVPSS